MATKIYQFKELPLRLFNQQVAAMRWLARQGLTAEEIRTFRWGNVDETTKTIKFRKVVESHLYDRESGLVFTKREVKDGNLPPIADPTLREFFFKSPTPSMFWVFLKHYPKRGHWRAEQQLDSLYSLDEIERFTSDMPELPEKIDIKALTFNRKFDTIEVSKLNFTN